MNNKKSNYENDDVRVYRKAAMKAARELCYGDEVQRRLRHAKSTAEISNIMKTARTGGK